MNDEMKYIELRKRTPEEREAYIQGLTAGLRMRLDETKPPTLVISIPAIISKADYENSRKRIKAEIETGLVTLQWYENFCGIIPSGADVDILVDAINEYRRSQKGGQEDV